MSPEGDPVPAPHSRLRALFEGITSAPLERRSQLLDALESKDATAAAEVRRLVELEALDDGFLESPLLSDSGRAELLAAMRPAAPPVRVGPYRLLEVLGQGGAGVVHRAEQEHPVRRIVAVKLLRPGLDSETFLRRFSLERQLLAQLRHPAIVQLLEAGVEPDGRPWFAMEYVAGEPILRFATRMRLDRDARLRLFVQVCDAIAHAHARDVIHRDLSPSNILAGEVEGRLEVKVIDFGVGKALGDASLFTGAGELLGTLRYGSPEQLRGEASEVDKRSDVFSLGAILYELLAGAPLRDLGESGKAESLRRALAWEQPRRIERGPWLVGDLAKVVSMAVEVEPAERTPSVAALRSDLVAVLDARPTSAGSRPLGRAARLVRRYRRIGIVWATVAAVLATALLVASFALGRAVRSEAEASKSRDEATAMLESLLARAIAVSEQAGMAEARRAMLELALDGAARRSSDGSLNTRMEILHYQALDRMADLEHERGDARRALQLREEALAIANTLAPQRAEAWRADARRSTALVKVADSRDALEPEYDVLPDFQAALDMDSATAARNPTVPSALDDLAWSLQRVMLRRFDRGDLDESRSLADQAIAVTEELVRLDPHEPGRWWALASAHECRGTLARLTADAEAQGRHLERSLWATDRMLEMAPQDRRAIMLRQGLAIYIPEAPSEIPVSPLAEVEPEWQFTRLLQVEGPINRGARSRRDGDLGEARAVLVDAVDRVRSEVLRTPAHEAAVAGLARSLAELAAVAAADGDRDAALAMWHEAVDTIEPLARARPWSIELARQQALVHVVAAEAGLVGPDEIDDAFTILWALNDRVAGRRVDLLETIRDAAQSVGRDGDERRARDGLARLEANVHARSGAVGGSTPARSRSATAPTAGSSIPTAFSSSPARLLAANDGSAVTVSPETPLVRFPPRRSPPRSQAGPIARVPS